MATIQELRNERLRKLNQLKTLGIDPYPASVDTTHTISAVKQQFEALMGQDVDIAGRIQTIRKFGKIAFIVVQEAGESIQLFLRQDSESLRSGNGRLGFNELPLLDSGDFIEAKGRVMRTDTGESSIEVQSIRMLSKSLRPLPVAREGFSNKEERLRRRYVDMNVNPEIRQRFIRRSRFWQSTRDFMNQHGFVEINIPVLEHTTGGADATPFVTHMDALDQDFYLRISHELPLKRLLGGGFDKVYDIGPRFRNENYSDEHLPEHVAMEWYWAFADWQDGMSLQTEMFRYVIEQTFETLQFKLNGFEVDLAKEWQRLDYAQALAEHYNGLDIFACNLEDVKRLMREHKLEVAQSDNLARSIDKLWKNIRKDIAGPLWLVNPPEFISPLAKLDPKRPKTVQRFQAIVAGSELSNGFSELNDPIEQYNRFVEQQKMRNAGDKEAMMMDIDFIEMLEYGMPPACGVGYSERVFWLFEGVSAREGVPFPQLRREVDPVVRAIYPEAQL